MCINTCVSTCVKSFENFSGKVAGKPNLTQSRIFEYFRYSVKTCDLELPLRCIVEDNRRGAVRSGII